MNESALLIIVGIIGLAIGFALGIAVTSLRTSRDTKVGDSSQLEARLSPPTPVTDSEKPKPIIEAAVPTTLPPVEAPPGASEAGELPSASSPAQRPTLSPVNVIARALQAEVRSPQPPPKSIATQIDEILQEMLENSTLATRAIRLLELPNKGMVVMVGLDQYEGVDAVPDEEIKKVIRAAVAEWEKRISE
jgi:hypothetical protein